MLERSASSFEPQPRRRRTARVLALSGALALLALALPAAPAVAASTSPSPSSTPSSTSGAGSSTKSASKVPVVTFGVEPYSADPHNTPSYFDINASPGAHVADSAAVLNYSTQPIDLTIAAGDGVNTSNGGFALVGATKSNRSVANWINIPAHYAKVHVPARKPGSGGPGRVIVPFTIVVPANATPGEHAGGITATLASSVKSASGQLFHLNQQTGSRLFIRVSGALHPQLTIEHLHATYHGALARTKGSATLTYEVVNTGNTVLAGAQRITVTGAFGQHLTVARPAQVPLLVPGGSASMSVTVPGVYPEIWMTARVSISPYVLPGAVEPPSGPFVASTQFLAIPWLIVIAILVLILGAVGWFLRRRRRRGSSPSRHAKSDPPSGNDETAAAVSVPDAHDPLSSHLSEES